MGSRFLQKTDRPLLFYLNNIIAKLYMSRSKH
jgi:hypothetical protein